jgi:Tfp pilus assembly protein FimV
MKILRILRGFTTNSSGANEYLPSARAPSVKEPVAEAGAEADASSTSPAPDAGITGTAAQPPGPRDSTGSSPMGNASVLMYLMICVLLLFSVGPVIRYVRRRLKNGGGKGGR